MKNQKLFLIALLVVPWLSVPLLGRKAFKRFLPTAIFMCTFTKAIDFYGEKKKWWKFYSGFGPFNSMNFMNFGPYFATSLWVLKMTYGKFPLFLITNVSLHILFIFGGLKFVKGFKVFSLENLTKFQYLFFSFIRCLILYAFQYITEPTRTKKSFFNKKWTR
ncbi:hypothetical protein [Neobacillus terrae]|uniref:hypothetical protein n=1 Tax=Neobacillus terrae TaxID=3034837 RepID=UPI00140A1A82|nr:hypothetical protein [Neobacillus terrae]NHM30690.1 hypothetical protein [Neobacillus terrae]